MRTQWLKRITYKQILAGLGLGIAIVLAGVLAVFYLVPQPTAEQSWQSIVRSTYCPEDYASEESAANAYDIYVDGYFDLHSDASPEGFLRERYQFLTSRDCDLSVMHANDIWTEDEYVQNGLAELISSSTDAQQ